MSESAYVVPRASPKRMPDPKRDSGWELLSNQGKVLVCLARDPDVRVSEIAEMVGIKERAVQRILAELRDDGLVTSTRTGRRNTYRINRGRTEPWAEAPVGKLLDALDS
jgi:DNA-binding transcriptional ArsR family regulator